MYVDGPVLLPRNQVVVLLHDSCLARFAHVVSPKSDHPSNAKFQKRAGVGVYAIDLVVAPAQADAEVRPDVGDW